MNTQDKADSGPNASKNGSVAHNADFARRAKEIARRATATATQLPSQLDERIKHNPYAAVGIACAVGAAAGIVLSSRVLRAVLMAALTTAAGELARTAIRRGASRFASA